MKHIVLMGGGSWISHLLPAFTREKDWQISAIIATGDSGGSSGVIRESYTVPALGDIVKNLSALGGEESKWLTHRYSEGFLAGHTTGNIWLLGLIETYGFEVWIKKAHTMLGYTHHQIIPVTWKAHDIVVQSYDGEVTVGEGPIVQNKKLTRNIAQMELSPSVEASPEAINALLWADCIILGPGTLYTSLIACLLPVWIQSALSRSKAKKIYIANAANFPPGHCDNYNLDDYLSELQRLGGYGNFNHILAHDGTAISWDQRIEVSNDTNRNIIDILTSPAENIDGIYDSIKRNRLRHDGDKVVQWIKKIFD